MSSVLERATGQRAALTVFAALAFAAGAAVASEETGHERSVKRLDELELSIPEAKSEARQWPADGAFAEAARLARERRGVISFAAVGPNGKEVDFAENRRFASASVTKAMLLVAELRRLEAGGIPLDEMTAEILEDMITFSDNDAASMIYSRVGDAGLYEVAELAGLQDFEVSGVWGDAQITASDMAHLAERLDELLHLEGGAYGNELLRSIIPDHSWGIPAAAPKGASVRFKGGWRPTQGGYLVHQVARVDAGRGSYSIAILTHGDPSMGYGVRTIRLIAEELLRRNPSPGEPGP